MTLSQTATLGAAAGFTIYLGLPAGRLRLLSTRARVGLAMFAVGVLAFILVDVLAQANGIVGDALARFKHGQLSLSHLAGLVALLAGGFAAGTAGLAVAERRMRGSVTAPAPPLRGGGTAAAVTSSGAAPPARALQTGLVVAGAIGLHNFGEGLAIGVSARAGAITLATVLIVGFALHNATEGFGIVGPLAGDVPSWRWLAGAGTIAGSPTFLGSVIGYEVRSATLELVCYAVAAGAILYVIGEIWTAVRRQGHRDLGLLLLSAGFTVGVATDLLVSFGGG